MTPQHPVKNPRLPNKALEPTAAAPFCFRVSVFISTFLGSAESAPRSAAAAAQLDRSSRHEVAFHTAWLDRFPDQALRVAAGIPRKHASGGLWPSGHYGPRYGAFPAM